MGAEKAALYPLYVLFALLLLIQAAEASRKVRHPAWTRSGAAAVYLMVMGGAMAVILPPVLIWLGGIAATGFSPGDGGVLPHWRQVFIDHKWLLIVTLVGAVYFLPSLMAHLAIKLPPPRLRPNPPN